MKFLSLFTGIGGIDLGLERAGHTCVGQVEIDEYATRVLQKHWPNIPRIRDIHDCQGHEFGSFDLLTGGYPCQPFSYAGQRQGDRDERHLWPEVHRIIRNVRPQYVLLENVTGHLSLGFGRVLGDLAESGYDVRWDCIPAAAIGAPHRRDRVFILANANDNGFVAAQKRNGAVQRSDTSSTREEATQQFTRRSCKPGGLGKNSAATLADATSRVSGQSQPHRIPSANRTAEPGERSCVSRSISDWWQTEPDVGRVAHGVPNRVDRLRGLGNAVVPQVVEWIARTWLPLTTQANPDGAAVVTVATHHPNTN